MTLEIKPHKASIQTLKYCLEIVTILQEEPDGSATTYRFREMVIDRRITRSNGTRPVSYSSTPYSLLDQSLEQK